MGPAHPDIATQQVAFLPQRFRSQGQGRSLSTSQEVWDRRWHVYEVIQRGSEKRRWGHGKSVGSFRGGLGAEGRDRRPTVLQESPWADPSSGMAPLALTANCTDPILQKRKPRLGDVAKSPSRRVVELGLKCRPLSSRAGASLSLTLELLTSGHLPSSPCAPSGQQLCFIQLCIPAVLVPKPQAKEPRRQPPLGSSLKTQVPGPHSQLLQQHLQHCGS